MVWKVLCMKERAKRYRLQAKICDMRAKYKQSKADARAYHSAYMQMVDEIAKIKNGMSDYTCMSCGKKITIYQPKGINYCPQCGRYIHNKPLRMITMEDEEVKTKAWMEQ